LFRRFLKLVLAFALAAAVAADPKAGAPKAAAMAEGHKAAPRGGETHAHAPHLPDSSTVSKPGKKVKSKAKCALLHDH